MSLEEPKVLEVNSSNYPQYAGDIPHIPMNFQDRDVLVGRLMGIIEAVLPQGRQLEATKDLMKQAVSNHFTDQFNIAFNILRNQSPTEPGYYDEYVKAIWEVKKRSAKISK